MLRVSSQDSSIEKGWQGCCKKNWMKVSLTSTLKTGSYNGLQRDNYDEGRTSFLENMEHMNYRDEASIHY